ncbi:MAG: hypothetical protein AABY83_00340 [Pseudomonadota bacterium]
MKIFFLIIVTALLLPFAAYGNEELGTIERLRSFGSIYTGDMAGATLLYFKGDAGSVVGCNKSPDTEGYSILAIRALDKQNLSLALSAQMAKRKVRIGNFNSTTSNNTLNECTLFWIEILP